MKVVAIIQARIGSKRLPGKVLMELEGKSILEHITNFLSFSKRINGIVIATTILEEDNQIEVLAKKIKIKCFRGSAENVLERFYQCAKFSNADVVVRITADDPIIDPILVDKMIGLCIKEKLDYVSNVLENSYPMGFTACEVFTFDTLSKLFHERKEPSSLEHVTTHIRNNQELFKIKSVSAPKGWERSNWRLTVDFPNDFLLIKEIFSKVYRHNKGFDYENLVKFLDKNPELLEINKTM